LVQALLVGAAALLPFAMWLDPAAVQACAVVLGIAGLAHVLFSLGEVTLAHVTEHARLATRTMTRGRYATVFWVGMAFVLIAGVLALVPEPALWLLATPLALIGLFAHEHAYVQAGQSVPLA
jgi:hypothetical protein